MSEPDRPRLSDVEQEVFLSAVEGDDLFHIVWGVRTVTGLKRAMRSCAPKLKRWCES